MDPVLAAQPGEQREFVHSSRVNAEREYGLDWLRVFAFTILILYHTGMMFVRWDFHIKNAEHSQALEYIMLFANRWRLPLLFLISGAAVFFSLRRRGYGEFARERLRRLLVPVVFAMFVVVPPQIYFERLYRGATFSYAEWYPSVFQMQPYPQGSFSWHHLWFVVYILMYSLCGIPFFAWVKSENGQRAIGAMVSAFERWPWAVYLVNIPNLIVGFTLGPHWPTTHNLIADWANLTGCFLTFLWGVVIASDIRFLDLITRRRREFLMGGVLVAVAFYAVMLNRWGGRTLFELLSAYFGMTWIFALLGYARHYVKSGGPRLRYATNAVYPFYIVHQTITIAVGYYVIQQSWGVWPKFGVVALATFAGSWLCYEVVRRTSITRLLFGLKP
jgi:glucans biosynthesis protein C